MNAAFLKKLGLKKLNDGTSTGLKSLKGKAGKINSYSPVDGKLIGSVSITSKVTMKKSSRLLRKLL